MPSISARAYRPLGSEELAALLSKTREAAAQGRYERYKTSNRFDSTTRNPEWLG